MVRFEQKIISVHASSQYLSKVGGGRTHREDAVYITCRARHHPRLPPGGPLPDLHPDGIYSARGLLTLTTLSLLPSTRHSPLALNASSLTLYLSSTPPTTSKWCVIIDTSDELLCLDFGLGILILTITCAVWQGRQIWQGWQGGVW